MLNRSLFEDMIDAHWVVADPEAATQCYSDHTEHSRMLLADAVSKYPEHYAEIEIPEFDEADRARLDVLYTQWGSKPWSRLNLHARVKLVEDQWTDEAARRTLWFFHDIAHRENNQTLHVTATSLNANVALSEDESNLVFTVGPRPDKVDPALFGSFWIFLQMLGLLTARFGFEVDDETRAKVVRLRDFVTLTDEQMRETGRNDPCPCGSGLKFKRCHGNPTVA
jgi:hypothetical protein